MGLYSIAGFLYHPVLFLTLATSIPVGKVQFTYMLLSIITGYLIVVKIYWNYGKLTVHVHSDYSLNNNTTALVCPLDFFVLSLVALLQWYYFFLIVLDQCGYYPAKHPSSTWLLLCPSLPPLGCVAGICRRIWTHFVACSRPNYKRAFEPQLQRCCRASREVSVELRRP